MRKLRQDWSHLLLRSYSQFIQPGQKPGSLDFSKTNLDWEVGWGNLDERGRVSTYKECNHLSQP